MRTPTDIHVSGVGLRLPPGLQGIDALWSHLLSGRDARHRVTETGPGRRYPAEDGAGTPSHEGLLADIASFEPEPFRISAREAGTLDPQQRLLLECTWECLADAGYSWNALQDRSVGVFIGAYAQDWLATVLDARGAAVDAASGTGTSLAVLANRLSYLLDVQGPSLTVDTACASSLTAVHLAVRAIRSGECERALVAGISVGHHRGYRELNGGSLPMSATGESRPFDVRADGIVRGEGAVVLLLEREEVSAGGRHGRILGTAIGHGGRTNGLTAPSSRGQSEVIRRALADAAVPAEDIRYLEAHGTGTLLGDPIEARALREVYGAAGRTCDVGSVKGTFGHTEAAAGIVGMLTALLVARYGIVPGQGGFGVENPAAELEASGLVVSAEARPITAESGSYATAVSSVGFGGAIAHAVVGAPTVLPRPGTGRAGVGEGMVLLASAATSAGLTAQREAIRRAVAQSPDAEVEDLTARQSRVAAAQPHRLAWSAPDASGLRQAVMSHHGGSPVTRVTHGARPLFVFSGQGSSWVGMGADLWRLPRLGAALDRWEAEVRELLGWSLRERLAGDVEVDTETAQVCTAAVQLAVVELLAGRGVHPAAVVGHSMGEAVAAVVSGSLTSREAFAVLAARSRTIEEHARGGGMLSVSLPVQEVEADLAGRTGVSIAAVNGLQATVVSGERDVLATLADDWTRRGTRVAAVPVDYAFHGPALAETAVDVDVTGHEPGLPWFSTVTGEAMSAPPASYWSLNVSEPVELTRAVEAAVSRTGARIVIEVSPRPVLTRHLAGLLGPETRVIPTMSRDEPAHRWIPELVTQLFLAGVDVDAGSLVGHRPAPGPVVQPVWQRRRFWLDADGDVPAPASPAGAPDAGPQPAGAPAGPAAMTGVSGPADGPEGIPTVPELAAFIAGLVASMVEGQDLDTVPLDEPTSRWEISSLSVVSVRNTIEKAFGMPAPLPVLLSGESPLDLARRLGAREVDALSDHQRYTDALARIDELTQDEIEALLADLEPLEEG